MRVLCETQGDDAWWAAKCGIPSASNFARIFKAKTGGISASAENYIAELIEERSQQLPKYFTGQGRPITPDMTAAMIAMDRGLELEPKARAWYQTTVGKRVYTTGFVTTDDGRWGCSPDFLLGEDIVGEIKIYDDASHAKWIQKDTAPTGFLAQIHGQLLITGRPRHHLVLWSETQEAKIIETRPNDTTHALRVTLEVFWAKFQVARQLKWEQS